MTKEEVAAIVSYCQENNVSQKARLAELGINPWTFYDAKRKYSPKQEGDNVGGFLQLVPGRVFPPDPIKPSRSRSGKQKAADKGMVAVSIELCTPSGTMMRISSDLIGRELRDIILASSIRVWPGARHALQALQRADGYVQELSRPFRVSPQHDWGRPNGRRCKHLRKQAA